MAVNIDTEPAFSAGTPRALLTGDYGADYAVAGDGRLLMSVDTHRTGETSGQTVVVLVENWFAARRIAVGPKALAVHGGGPCND